MFRTIERQKKLDQISSLDFYVRELENKLECGELLDFGDLHNKRDQTKRSMAEWHIRNTISNLKVSIKELAEENDIGKVWIYFDEQVSGRDLNSDEIYPQVEDYSDSMVIEELEKGNIYQPNLVKKLRLDELEFDEKGQLTSHDFNHKELELLLARFENELTGWDRTRDGSEGSQFRKLYEHFKVVEEQQKIVDKKVRKLRVDEADKQRERMNQIQRDLRTELDAIRSDRGDIV